MQLTSKEINRNQKVSIGVTIFSFMVLLLFLIFKNMLSPSSSLGSIPPAGINISMSDNNPFQINDNNKAAGYLGEKREDNRSPSGRQSFSGGAKKEVTVSDNDLNAFNDAANELLEAFKANSAKTNILAENKTGSDNPVTDTGKNNLKSDDAQFDFDLGKRTLLNSPEVTNDTNEEGKVIVDIVVDKNGTVVEANPNGRGTTTNSSKLKAKAKQMAIASKFSPAAGSGEQRGSITINFSFK